MSAQSPTGPFTTPSPSMHENLVGAIVWLLPAAQIPDHGRYKLKAKACGHPCVVVEDCRIQGDESVRVSILTSYSQSTSYNSLGAQEQYHHVPIYPNTSNDLAQPSIVYLRHRQKSEVALKKTSWINTRNIYKVPVSILRPYETYQSWCRYRLTNGSIQALQSALGINVNTLDLTLLQAPRLSFSSPVSQNELGFPDMEKSPTVDVVETSQPNDQQSVAGGLLSSITMGEQKSDIAGARTNQIEPHIVDEDDTADILTPLRQTDDAYKFSASYTPEQYLFYRVYPFYDGLNPTKRVDCKRTMLDLMSLPLPATSDATRRGQQQSTWKKKLWHLFASVSGLSLLLLAAFAVHSSFRGNTSISPFRPTALVSTGARTIAHVLNAASRRLLLFSGELD